MADQSISEDLFRLADPVGAVDGLRFDGRIPPRVQQEDVAGRRQVEAEAAGLETDEEQIAGAVGLETLDNLATLLGFAVEVGIRYSQIVEMPPDIREELGELGKDKDLVAFLEDLRGQQPRSAGSRLSGDSQRGFNVS